MTTLPPELFVDTSFFVALLNSRDVYHQPAISLQMRLDKQKIRKVTSEYILVELGDGLSRLQHRPLASRLIHLLQRDPTFTIVPTTSDVFQRAVRLFDNRPDKEWGLTDCASMTIMDEWGLNSVLTADQHFQQAGYQILLSKP